MAIAGRQELLRDAGWQVNVPAQWLGRRYGCGEDLSPERQQTTIVWVCGKAE